MTATDRLMTSLQKLAAHSDRDVRRHAARCVGRLTGAETLERIRSLADDTDATVRREALRALSERDPQGHREHLLDAFVEDTDAECRQAALEGLVAIGDRDVVPALRRLIRNPDALLHERSPHTRSARISLYCDAVRALGALGEEVAAADLHDLLGVGPALDAAIVDVLAARSGTRPVTAATAPAGSDRRLDLAPSANVGEPNLATLAALCDHDDASVRMSAIQQLGRLQPDHDALAARVVDPEPRVRATLARTLGRAQPDCLHGLLADIEPEVLIAALEGGAAEPDGRPCEKLQARAAELVHHPDADVAVAAARTLSALDREAARIALGDVVADDASAPGVRAMAARFIASIGGQVPIGTLLRQLIDTDEAGRVTAGEALVTLVQDPVIGDEVERSLADMLRTVTLGLLPPTTAADASTLGLAETAPSFAAGAVDASARTVAQRLALISTLVDVLGNAPSTRGQATLTRIAAGIDDAQLREAAARALATKTEASHQVPTDAAVFARDLLDRDDSPALKTCGTRILLTADDDEDVGRFVTTLVDGPSEAKAHVLRWLQDTRRHLDETVFHFVEQALDDERAEVRATAMQLLLSRQGESAVPAVVELVVRRDDDTAAAATALLEHLPLERIHRDLARRLGTARSRGRQLALLRLSDAVLASSEPAASA
ncbi:MAG: HEAT repeat domain-containing protein [Pseudomonadota bacterium]